MSKLKKLAANFERYNITLEHQFIDAPSGIIGKIPTIKATIVIPDETNQRFLKRVSTNFTPGASIQDAEKSAVNNAVDMILGNKLTKKLTDKYKVFDLQLIPFNGPQTSPVGIKVILNVCTEDGKPFRSAVSLATGTDSKSVEAEVVKNAINSILGA